MQDVLMEYGVEWSKERSFHHHLEMNFDYLTKDSETLCQNLYAFTFGNVSFEVDAKANEDSTHHEDQELQILMLLMLYFYIIPKTISICLGFCEVLNEVCYLLLSSTVAIFLQQLTLTLLLATHGLQVLAHDFSSQISILV